MTLTGGREAREGRVREDVIARVLGTKCAIDLMGQGREIELYSQVRRFSQGDNAG